MTVFEDLAGQVRTGAIDAEAAAAQLLADLDGDELLWLLDGDQPVWSGARAMLRAYNTEPVVAGAIPRLGIPGIRFTDGPRGVVVGSATAFPAAVARAATFDPDLERRIGAAIGGEARALGANLFAGVCVNLLRHPGWGRAQESYGEDPLLLGTMGAALTAGARPYVMVCVKHFACNSIEDSRFRVDVLVDEATLHEVYLPHFRQVVDAGADCVMSAYNAVNGEWCGQHRTLLTDVLREEWGFGGFVMTDFVFGLRDPVLSVAAGQDLEMPFRQQRAAALPAALRDGRLGWELVRAAGTRLLAGQLRYAARVGPRPPADVVACDAHRALAREAAAQACVLLRNDPVDGMPVLPLDPEPRTLAVLGPLADRPNLGDHGSSQVRPPVTVSVLAGLREALGADRVRTAAGDTPEAAADAARRCDAAVVVLGLTERDEGEAMVALDADSVRLMGPPVDRLPVARAASRLLRLVGRGRGRAAGGDRRDLRLHPGDVALVRAVAAANPRTVVVLIGGSAVLMEEWRRQVPAILLAWYPGMEGGRAVADVLLGRAEPGGRLPFAIPVDAGHLPRWDPDARVVTYDRWWGQRLLDRDRRAVAFPFGFGLGYSHFRIDALHGDESDGRVTATVDVTNTGPRRGSTVVQLYAYDASPAAPAESRVRQLVGFAGVTADPGERRSLDVTLSRSPARRRDATAHTWRWQQGDWRVVAAQHARDTTGPEVALRLADAAGGSPG